MTVLVTGAAGFLGSHLCEELLARGFDVTGVDNFATSNPDNLAALRGNPRFTFVEADVCDALPPAPPVEAILHFASPASPRDYAAEPLATLRVNSAGTERCCERALRDGSRLIFASTSEVYGDPLAHPQPEAYWGNVNCNGERSCYDEGKRYGEALVFAYRRTYGLDARIARIFNTYGPRMRADDGRVVPTMIRQALSGEPLTVFGDGSQTRSLCYVDDLVDGILRYLALSDPSHRVVNLGSEIELSVNAIAGTIAELCCVPLRTVRRPLPPDDPVRRRPDISIARGTLSWSPQTPLRDGMQKTIDWFRSTLSRENVASC